ncbi:MAG: hypothetical protein ABW022_03205 [Actinoplanes sp.]
MTTLQPLLARDRYSDEEWEYASAGRCIWVWPVPSQNYCLGPSDPQSHYRFCTPHDVEVREDPLYGRD